MTKNNIINTIVVGSGGIFTALFGKWEIGLQILITFMILDYIMGIMCAYKNKEISSQIGFVGLTKKFSMLMILIIAVSLDRLMGQGWVFRTLVIYFYVANEGISILENASRLNVSVPGALLDVLVQLREGNKKGGK